MKPMVQGGRPRPRTPPRSTHSFSQLRHARNLGVGLTTFDTGGEVDKLAAHHPSCRALLRLRFDVATAQCSLGAKYGCQPEAAAGLLEHAARRGIAVVGVAFHIGSNAHDPATYGRAVAAARVAFDAGAAAGHVMTVLDVGGGFAGGDPADMLGGLGPTVAALNAALAAHFPPSSGVRVIAEPGRYFATHAMTLACAINGVRVRGDGGAEGGEGGGGVDYWLSDGIYGGFNSIVYDTARPTFFPLKLGGGEGERAAPRPTPPPCSATPPSWRRPPCLVPPATAPTSWRPTSCCPAWRWATTCCPRGRVPTRWPPRRRSTASTRGPRRECTCGARPQREGGAGGERRGEGLLARHVRAGGRE